MIGPCRIFVHQDGPWCMIEIPELAGLTQAQWRSDADAQARSYIATATGCDVADIAIEVVDTCGPINLPLLD